MHRTTVLDDYKPYLYQQFAAGRRNASQLFREIRDQGYRGTLNTAGRYVHLLKKGLVPAPPARPVPPPRRASGWIMTDSCVLRPEQSLGLKEVQAACFELEAAVRHVRTFGAMMHDLRGDRLPRWTEAVRQDDLPALRQYAEGLLHDRDAVVAGLTSTWSSGQVEGHNTRAKLIKRMGYGRANFDLLRRRIPTRA
ncbi:transposase [Streptomyces phaeochromogenes]|uniref:transposase n=1 Tax=Streptomyces phaeochromogenes TaxID=1923 RepID=UPI00371386CA